MVNQKTKSGNDKKKKPTCFIAMPMSVRSEYFEKYGDSNHWEHIMESLFVPSLKEAGFEPIRPSAIGSDIIHQSIFENINNADLVLVDLSTQNPNVFFELGLRIALNKPVVLIVDSREDIPFDINIINIHQYSDNINYYQIEEERSSLAEHIKSSWRKDSENNAFWKIFDISLEAKSSTNIDESRIMYLLLERIEELAATQKKLSRIVEGEGIHYNNEKKVKFVDYGPDEIKIYHPYARKNSFAEKVEEKLRNVIDNMDGIELIGIRKNSAESVNEVFLRGKNISSKDTDFVTDFLQENYPNISFRLRLM